MAVERPPPWPPPTETGHAPAVDQALARKLQEHERYMEANEREVLRLTACMEWMHAELNRRASLSFEEWSNDNLENLASFEAFTGDEIVPSVSCKEPRVKVIDGDPDPTPVSRDKDCPDLLRPDTDEGNMGVDNNPDPEPGIPAESAPLAPPILSRRVLEALLSKPSAPVWNSSLPVAILATLSPLATSGFSPQQRPTFEPDRPSVTTKLRPFGCAGTDLLRHRRPPDPSLLPNSLRERRIFHFNRWICPSTTCRCNQSCGLVLVPGDFTDPCPQTWLLTPRSCCHRSHSCLI